MVFFGCLLLLKGGLAVGKTTTFLRGVHPTKKMSAYDVKVESRYKYIVYIIYIYIYLLI